jgi:hypothetical protein
MAAPLAYIEAAGQCTNRSIVANGATTYNSANPSELLQNGNAYEEGLTDGWAPIRAYWEVSSETNRDGSA